MVDKTHLYFPTYIQRIEEHKQINAASVDSSVKFKHSFEAVAAAAKGLCSFDKQTPIPEPRLDRDEATRHLPHLEAMLVV